ncbi:aspartic ase pepstatin-sensitive [Fusarium beomiforme]|uniref:Aspartic ase pepstatin-sensitive n=1 Tax=Fusarium beomiforme TaxID=44412 RepID=A0A9P5DMZ2_9HYPO|nr:aspartic ase pepstatin-sensitive [Fusarium beomiforme]
MGSVTRFASAILAATSFLGTASAAVLDMPVTIKDGYKMVDISVGKPAQTFKLLFDTGSASAWMVDSTCAKECPHVDKNRVGYNIKASSTGKYTGESANIDYLGGVVAGPTVQERFQAEGVTWEGKFIAANESSWSSLAAAGFMGLAFSAIEDGGATPVFESLMAEKKVDEPRFGIYYSKKDGDDTHGKPGRGLLTLGGSREKKYVKGDLITIPINTNINEYDVWRSILHSTITSRKGKDCKQNKTKVDFGGIPTVFDTGASGITLPKDKINAIYESIGMNYTAILKGEHVPLCSEFTKDWSVAFEVGFYGETKFLNVTGDQLAVPGFANRDDACWPPFDDGAEGFALIGVRFLRNFYTIWDYGEFPKEAGFINPSLSFGYLKPGY